jgi:hypothetical protein
MKKGISASRALAGASTILAIPIALLLLQPTPLSARTIADGIVTGKTDQGYPYMSGGVGVGERNQMNTGAQGYDLKLAFSDRSGKYLSDVKVTIADPRGDQIVDTSTAGPWFYINLPSGKYDVKASYDNRVEEIKNIDVSKGQRIARLLHWNDSDQQISQN